MYVLRFSFTALFNGVKLPFISYPNKYKFIANGLFFSFSFEVLPIKNFVISSFIDCSVGSKSSGLFMLLL